MKLVTFMQNDKQYIGAVIDKKIINLNNLLDNNTITMDDLVKSDKNILTEIKQKVQNMSKDIDGKNIVDQSDVVIHAPLSNPGKVVCVGLNYMDHCREQNVEAPEKPLIFSKWPSCIIGPDENIILPEESNQVDFEAELGVIFNERVHNISEENVLNSIFGYIITNDISARDVQFKDEQWTRGKSYDTFLPCGPYLVTADEIPDPNNLFIQCKVNDKLLQDSNTKEMIFNIKEIVSYLSRGFTFMPGDLLLTGTPHGVGVFREPQVFLEDGDEVLIEIEGLGVLRNRCIRKK